MKFTDPLSLDRLIGIIKQEVTVVNSADSDVLGINEIHSVEEGDLTFSDHDKYYDKVLASKATFILLDKEVECPEGKVLLICEDPLRAYLDVVHSVISFNPQKQLIHPDAKIGRNTIIQPNVFIGENVEIGDNCIIHSNVSIYADTTIGNHVIIHSNTTIGADACYFQKRDNHWLKLDSCGNTVIEDGVEVGCRCCIDKGVSGPTRIGEGTKFDNLVQIGHDTSIGKRCLLGAQSAVAGCTVIDDDCTVWAKSAINKDLYVAKKTTILAVSALDRSVTIEGQTLFGVPAEDVRKKWREIASIKYLPEVVEQYRRKK